MPDQSDEAFLLKGEELVPLPARSMRAGLFGKTLEDAIQTLLQKYPQRVHFSLGAGYRLAAR